ncbi:SipW-dependent-type signal peptide-containing protein [Rhodococcus sp. MEB041]|uniref:SipW-dependent-type signal peptide-containing protein n=1 Tax=Rhodococcus sp. MEB041 TaxID=3040323 RepID=UPI00254BA7E5|nr:SipW-dependent-type signal peptide-containing protein [Rhodococcus sp. MEB041]
MTHPPVRPPGRMSSARLRALLSLGIVLGLGSVGTMAAWSETATATSGVFTTGYVDLKLDGVDNDPVKFKADVQATAMMPGTTITTPLVVSNSGTVPFRYSTKVRASTSELGNLLKVAIAAGSCPGSEISSATTLSSTSDATIFSARGPVAASGSDPLCVAVSIPASVILPVIPASGTITLTFDATST